jgi:hypothetical protein
MNDESGKPGPGASKGARRASEEGPGPGIDHGGGEDDRLGERPTQGRVPLDAKPRLISTDTPAASKADAKIIHRGENGRLAARKPPG